MEIICTPTFEAAPLSPMHCRACCDRKVDGTLPVALNRIQNSRLVLQDVALGLPLLPLNALNGIEHAAAFLQRSKHHIEQSRHCPPQCGSYWKGGN